MTDRNHTLEPQMHGGEAPYGSPEAYRESIAEHLAMTRIQAELGITYAQIGDDVGLAYTARRLVAYFKAALGDLNDLQESKKRGNGRG
jgi:hypothetical protein